MVPMVKLAKVDLRPCNHPHFMLLFLFPVNSTTPTFQVHFLSPSQKKKEDLKYLLGERNSSVLCGLDPSYSDFKLLISK